MKTETLYPTCGGGGSVGGGGGGLINNSAVNRLDGLEDLLLNAHRTVHTHHHHATGGGGLITTSGGGGSALNPIDKLYSMQNSYFSAD